MKNILLEIQATHDLSLVANDLYVAGHNLAAVAAKQSVDRHGQFVGSVSEKARLDLLVAAVAFAIQLAIEVTSHDPNELRALESKLIARITGDDEVITLGGPKDST